MVNVASLSLMTKFAHEGLPRHLPVQVGTSQQDAAPAGKINRRISQPITSLAGGERRRLFTYRTMVSGDENGDSGK
ncbi:uncharacterized protein ACWYII_018504 isoform 5-T5 [Salvelinus alpinus]